MALTRYLTSRQATSGILIAEFSAILNHKLGLRDTSFLIAELGHVSVVQYRNAISTVLIPDLARLCSVSADRLLAAHSRNGVKRPEGLPFKRC